MKEKNGDIDPTVNMDGLNSVVSTTPQMNRKRYINVIFSDLVRPLLADRGKSLSKDDLTKGKKTDQDIHEVIAHEYNCKTGNAYNLNAFPGLTNQNKLRLKNKNSEFG